MNSELKRAAVGWFSLMLVGCMVVIPLLPMALR